MARSVLQALVFLVGHTTSAIFGILGALTLLDADKYHKKATLCIWATRTLQPEAPGYAQQQAASTTYSKEAWEETRFGLLLGSLMVFFHLLTRKVNTRLRA